MTTVYSIYSDGNYFPRAKKSGFGGYIEDPEGQVLVEYTEQIKQPEYIHNFEPLGIIRGLQLAQIMGLKNIISYCDDKTSMLRMQEILANGGSVEHLPQNAKPELFAQIIALSKQFDSAVFQYIPRAKNKHSDSLSRRYAGLMEQNFMRQYEVDLINSENILNTQEKPKNRIFFSHPSLVKMKDKNNPFLVAPTRNKKSRKISRVEQNSDYQYLFIEEISENDQVKSLTTFYYINPDEKEILYSKEFNQNTYSIDSFCSFLNESISFINKKNQSPLWIYSNSKIANKIFEQKEKLPKESFELFAELYSTFSLVSRIMYHSLPFKHEYSPRIALKEQQKNELSKDIETVDFLMEQLQNGVLGRTQNKYFGKLIRYQLRNYRKLLDRDLNEVEKQEIIQNTTSTLENQGLSNLPKLIKK